jgi:tetratricopeptide (TPR) repeat protein
MVEFEKHIESQHITGSMSHKAEQLFGESRFLINRNQKSAQLSSASLQLYGLYLKHGYVRNENDYEQVTTLFHKWLPDHDLSTLDFYEKMYYFQSHVWYSNMCHDFLNYYKYAQRWVNLYHEHPSMVIKETASYLKGLHNVLNALFLAGKYTRFLSSYNELLDFNKDGQILINRNEASLLVLFQNVHRINLHYMQGSFSEGVKEIPELERVLKINKYNWDSHRIMVFHYKIACLYFGMGENEKAIHYLNLIINNYIPRVREDIQSFARILNLIAHFELGNKFLISYQIKSVYRFLLKMNDMHAVQKEILKFLRKTPTMKTDQLPLEFKKLKNTLILIQDAKYEKRPFLYLDIISWLQSKLNGVIVEKVIADNFNNKWKGIPVLVEENDNK